MTIRSRGASLGRGLVRLGLLALIGLVAVISLVTSVEVTGLPGTTNLPEVPAVDRATMDKAAASQGGEVLRKTGYEPKLKVSDQGLVEFLNEQQRKVGAANPGPYVLFSMNKPQVARANADTPPDAIVDATHGVIVALSQEFTNGRGSACHNARGIDILSSNWVVINEYLHGKLMPLRVPVTRDLVPSLTQGFPDTNCYVYPS